jgi:transposase-like protein
VEEDGDPRGNARVWYTRAINRMLRARVGSPPSCCPYCRGRKLTRKGIRRKKLEIVQLWRCASCERVFTPSPPELRNKTYPLRAILDGLTTYNLGYPLRDTAAKLESRYGHLISPSTISSWLSAHKQLASYSRLCAKGRSLFPPPQVIRSIKLYHRQVYRFAYHRVKLALLRSDKQHARFAPLADFLERVPTTCPHELFGDGSRASQAQSEFLKLPHAVVSEKQNFATRTAAFILPTVGDNRLRHDSLQRFMLANDSVTVAVEIPIWLTAREIAAIEAHYGVEILPKDARPRVITGHIDFVQVRNGAIHILDYKPDARTNRPVAQLTIYALALARRTGIKLFDITCAWFNEETYCEFFPRTLMPKRPGRARYSRR